MAATYREQYDRMVRWHNRFAATAQGRVHNTASDNYVDEIHAFFLNCYHLKDWIAHDDGVPDAVRKAVEDYVSSNRSLCLSADICNSLKHLRLKSSRSGENPKFGAKHYALSLGPGLPTTISLTYEIDTNGGPQDAFRLATDCVAAWNEFLTMHRL